jgi:pimeloyl-ACP methyl ester carboxylesterase
MKDHSEKLVKSGNLALKGATLLRKRLEVAQENFSERARAVFEAQQKELLSPPASPLALWESAIAYGVDFAQRSVLLWDTLRQRGNDFVERERAGKPPLLHFDYEVVLDGRTLARPVNYALVRILPPEGVTVDAAKRAYVIIDPRAGHGPGIGGFKDDSQVGVALRAGHPVYFVIFYPEPEPGQTLLDVCAAEDQFVRKVRALHPSSPKPVIVGNCQGGWAAMMLAASNPEDTGPIVINGAPMSYWSGAWTEGASDNPMRYSGGLLGGTWLSSFTADLANGEFDGAWLVQNFENLNPANTFVDKLYNVFANVDTEAPRFLEFERWWGGFYLMNREEIEWITQNLFVGNKLWTGGTSAGAGKLFDLREIRSPIILFASMGDNITPPQQAFNWVADVYGSTDEIKARGQVIVGLVHGDVGHLGIFVSGKVAKKEHAQIVEVLKSVESLPAGLYAMQIHEEKGADGKVEYRVEFTERQLEEVMQRLNRLERADEKAFEAVTTVSDFNQRAYELFAQPLVQAMSNEASAKMQRMLHPLRTQRWMFSDLNPFLAWLKPAADMVRAQRKALAADAPARTAERAMVELTSAALDYYRAVRDALSEAAFFQVYGNMFAFNLAGRHEAEAQRAGQATEPRELPVVKEALAAMEHGGFPEAAARLGALLARKGEPLPLERLELRHELIEEYRDVLPQVAPDEWRRIRGEQDIIVRYEPERALEASCRYLAYELGGKGIRVHAISPGPLKTRAASGLKDFELLLNEAAQRAPIGELVDVMDVGYTCAYLATPYARRLSGATLYVDGGVNIMA